ncbi:MAG: hypothetical protein ACKVWR_15040 [Acidimicrobiales bacterium]
MNEDLERLLDLLDQVEVDTLNTSVRLPAGLRQAAALAARLGLADSVTALTVAGLRRELEAVAQRAVLDAHYRQHPAAKPSLAEITLAAAELEGNPLADRPELIRRAADEVAALRADPDADDVLLYAAGLAAATA